MYNDLKNLTIKPKQKPHYTLDALISACDAAAPLHADEGAWMNMPDIGNELGE